jgi:hypothetical protein
VNSIKQDLTLRVEVLAGVEISSAIEQMVRLATEMGMAVAAEMNGVHVTARPNVKHEALYEAWSEALHSRRTYKTALV